MPLIKIKRGMKQNLPNLANGELAITTDTKELFAGTTTTGNINLSPIKSNIIANGNFQRHISHNESGSVNVVVASAIYGFGNFLFTNQPAASGNFTFARDYNNNGKVNIISTGALPQLDYKEKYFRAIIPEGTYAYTTNLDGNVMTLSFDYTNNASMPINFTSGCINNYVNGTIPATSSGRYYVTFNYASTNPLPFNYPIFSVTILKILSPFSGTLALGNIKLEMGTYPTRFTTNQLQLDSALIERHYYEKTFSLRSSFITPSTVQLILGDITTASIYNVKVALPNFKIYNAIGVLQTGFTSNITFNNTTGLAEATFTKLSHGLTDCVITGLIIVDNRPYTII